MSPPARPRRPLRLTLVTETFPPEVNGVARTLGRWVDAFRSRGHSVRIIHPRRRGDPADVDLVYGIRLPFYHQVRLGVAGPRRLGRVPPGVAPGPVPPPPR